MNPQRGAPAPPSLPTTPRPVPRIGIALFDNAVGPLASTGRLVVVHDADRDPTPLLEQILHHWLLSSGHAVVASFDRAPAELGSDFLRLGFDFVRFNAQADVVDLRSVKRLQDATALLAPRLQPAPAPLLFLLSGLSEALRRFDEASLLSWVAAVSPPGTSHWTVLAVPKSLQAWARPDDVVASWSHRRVGDTRLETLRLVNLPGGSPFPLETIPCRVEHPGGVRAHIPKILVTGAHNSGKSTFIHALCLGSLNVERLGTTVSLDHGQLERRGITIELFGTPGQERFDPIIRQAAQGAVGAIVLVDGTRPETFARTQHLAEAAGAARIPTVWAVSKQDVSGVRTMEEVRTGLRLAADVPVLPLVAHDALSGGRVVDALIEHLLATPRDASA